MKIRRFNEMNREEFIKWLETETDFERKYDRDNWDIFHRMVDYADYIFDEVEVNDDNVIFSWEYRTFGDTEDKKDEYSFEEFVDRYKKDNLKY
jgi:hypothetical protein